MQKHITILMAVLFLSGPAYSQHPSTLQHYSIKLGIANAGDGHGAYYTYMIEKYKGKHVFGFGPLIQKRSMEMGGFQLAYTYRLSHEIYDDCPFCSQFIELNVFSQFWYNSSQPLSYSVVKYEQMIHGRDAHGICNLRLQTMDWINGFSLRLNFDDRVSWQLSCGAVVFHHTNYSYPLDLPKTGVSLYLSSALQFTFK